jgi:hypothetical protein
MSNVIKDSHRDFDMEYDMSHVTKTIIDILTWNMAQKYMIGFMFHLLLLMFHMKIKIVENN